MSGLTPSKIPWTTATTLQARFVTLGSGNASPWTAPAPAVQDPVHSNPVYRIDVSECNIWGGATATCRLELQQCLADGTACTILDPNTDYNTVPDTAKNQILILDYANRSPLPPVMPSVPAFQAWGT